MNYYNENDPKAAAWIRELIRGGHIPDGFVDERSILEVKPADLAGYRQCHFFAGIAGWALALRLAGVPDDEEIWTGSCPCQPLSSAGLQLGHADERHLWPAFFNLVAICKPATVLGEQVASADGREWLAGIRADLEGVGYACGASDLPSAGVGAPIIRQRIYWVARAESRRLQSGHERARAPFKRTGSGTGPTRHGSSGGLAESTGLRSEAGLSGSITREKGHARKPDDTSGIERARERERERETPIVWVVRAEQPGLEGHSGHEHDRNEPRWVTADSAGSATAAGAVSAWSRCQLIDCLDGKTRRIEPESFPLAHGVPGRVGLLRGYGNAICPQLAAVFIQAAMTP